MKPTTEIHVFQPHPDLRAVVEVTDFGPTMVVNIECAGELTTFEDDFDAWYEPIMDRCYQKPSLTYFDGVATLTWPVKGGEWATFILRPQDSDLCL